MKSPFKTLTISVCSLVSGFYSNAQTLVTPGSLVGFSPNGYVGVNTGTNSPAFMLSVHSGTNQLNDGIQVLQKNASSAALRLDNAYTGGRSWGILSTSNGNTQGGGKLLFYDYSGGGERMVVTGTGSVGIGAFGSGNPLERLHVHDGAIRITGANNNGGPMVLFGGAINGNTSGAPNGQWGIEYVNNTSNPALCGLNFWRPNFAHNISGGGAGMQNAVMFMRNDNHIGIMTDNPTAQLTVNGKTLIGDPSVVNINTTYDYNLYVQKGILAERVKVALNNTAYWADYVFASDYKLSSLDAVAAYVKEHKHLPNVPSADEVHSNGLDVAEMDATLLRQVEEIWLHLIELKKENQMLKEQLTKKD